MWNGLDYKPFFDTMSRQILHDRASDAIPIFRGQGTGEDGGGDERTPLELEIYPAKFRICKISLF